MANRLETDRQTAAITPPRRCTGAVPLCCPTALLLYCSAVLMLCCTAGCGTTRSSDTNRTATEQLLISDAIDRAVQTLNLQTLAGQSVYLDDTRLGEVVDRNYLVSTLRQHLLASGCSLRAERDQADYIVEARAGAIGTDRNDLLFGVPSMNVPQILPVQPVPAAIPEVPIAKRRDQRGIAKIAVFAYHRESGTPVWQSGIAHQESSSNDVWILGAGPFQRGTIYEGTEFAGKKLGNDDAASGELHKPPRMGLARERVFTTPLQIAQRAQQPQEQEQGVVQAVHSEDVIAALPQPAADAVQDAKKAEPTETPIAAASPAEPATSAAVVVGAQSAEAPWSTSPPPQGGAVRPVLSASVYEAQRSRNSGAIDTSALLSHPGRPVPHGQPRLNSPR
jgi:hypothetical protein